jgi:hypothetical protein
MAIAGQQMRPVAHLPLVLGVLRHLEGASLLDALIPPHPAHVRSPERGGTVLVLAILDGDPALYKVRQRLEERGLLALLQAGFTRASRPDSR